MDSPTDLFNDSTAQIRAFAPTHSSTDLPVVHPQPSAGRPPPAFRQPGFPLIHHLLQPGGAQRRLGGQLNPNLNSHSRHLEDTGLEEDREERDGQVERDIEGEEAGVLEGEERLVKKRHSDVALAAEWGQDVLKMKRMKLESRARDGEAEEGVRKGKEGKRREREELKEQLEEARERLQALQEKVWRAFGEKNMAEEEKKKRNRYKEGEGREGDVGFLGEEEITEGLYDDEDTDTGDMEKETFSLLSVSPFDSFHKRREERQKDRERRIERGRGGSLHLEGVMEGAGLWLDCGGLVRGDWQGGMEEESEEGGQKFAQALKLELGSAVARVIDRVLRLYTEMTDVTPSSPPAAISFLPADTGHDGARERGMWMGLLAREEDKMRGKDEKRGEQDEEKEKQKHSNGSTLPPQCNEPSDLGMPLAVQRSPDIRKAHPLLGPPLSTHLNPSHPNLSLHHPSLPRPPPLSHPPLLPAASQPKDPSSSSSFHHSSSSSSSSSSFPPPPPPPPPHPLPLPLLHYSMQQLFSRSLHHPQLPHLPPSRKDYLSTDPFLEFSSHPSSHPSFPPLPLLGHLDPSLARHAHGGRDRERGIRGDGGIRGGGGMDGELYLTAGGISF